MSVLVGGGDVPLVSSYLNPDHKGISVR